MKILQKKLILVIAVVVILSGVFALGGCNWLRPEPRPPRPPIYIESECGHWVYRTVDWGGEPLLGFDEEPVAVLVSILNSTGLLDENGFLVIPTEIDGYRVGLVGDLENHRPHPAPQARSFQGGGKQDSYTGGCFCYNTPYIKFIYRIC